MSKPIINNINTLELNNLLDEFNKKITGNLYRIRSRNLTKRLIFNSINFGKFMVIDKYKNPNKQKYVYFYTIKFIDTGYVLKNIAIKEIRTGSVRDSFYKSIFNIGYMGDTYIELKNNDYKLYKSLYYRWHSMMSRCYNKNDSAYKFYGDKGVHVSNRWLCFSNYCEDVIKLDNFDRDLVIAGKLSLDKDKLQKDSIIKKYSNKYCCWITMKEQSKFVDHELAKEDYKKYVTRIYPNNKIEIFKGIGKYARENNLSKSNIQKCISGIINDYKGSKFRESTKEEINYYNKNI